MTPLGNTTWRRAWAVLALATALVFSFMAGAGHASPHLNASDAPVAASAHYPGDADAGRDHHVGGSHCAIHCSGHVAATVVAQSASAQLTRHPAIYTATAMATFLGTDNEPLTPPPTA